MTKITDSSIKRPFKTNIEMSLDEEIAMLVRGFKSNTRKYDSPCMSQEEEIKFLQSQVRKKDAQQ